MTRDQKESLAAFTRWSTGPSFQIVLGRAQTACLVAVHAAKGHKNHPGRTHPRLRCWVTAVRGLCERGLVSHHWDEYTMEQKKNSTYDMFYKVTEAGELVIKLLKLVGTYDILLAEFHACDEKEEMERIRLIPVAR